MEAAGSIDWVRPPSRALFDDNAPLYEWYADGLVNGCLERRRPPCSRPATATASPSSTTAPSRIAATRSPTPNCVTVSPLFAGALRARGVEKGDRVIIYMPMVPEALEAMLACARLGAIHCVVFGRALLRGARTRRSDRRCDPKAIIAGSCGIEPGRVVHYKPLLDDAISQARHTPEFCVIFQRDAGGGES